MKSSIFDVTKSDKDLSIEYADYVPEFIVTGIIKKFGKNLFAAERGAGKTRMLLFVAYAIIFELESILGYKINSLGDVLFINLEIPEKDFKAFIEPIKNHFESKLGLVQKHDLLISSFREGACKLNDIKLIVQKYRPLLTIIDSYKLYQALICIEENQREINNSNFSKVFRLFDELISEFQTSIVLINHTNKDTRNKASNSDLMFGPGALPDFFDHTTLIRKTRYPNQRLVVPDKSRYCGEGHITTNLVEILSSDEASACPESLHIELLEEDVDEFEYLPTGQSNRIPDETKQQMIKYILENKPTYAEVAKKFLGNANRKGTVNKIWKKHLEQFKK